MGIIDKNWIDAHDNALVAKLKPLSDAQIVRDWETIPGENTLLYDLGTELSHDYHSFKIGDELRVANQEAENGYDYYKLIKITGTSPNLTALWRKEGEGGDYKGSITINLVTLVSTGSDPVVVSNSDLNGAVVTLTADNESVSSQTWNGTSLVFKNLAPLKTYSISVTAGTSQMSKYLAPTSIPSVESLGIGAKVTRDINYTADQYSVSIDSDQDDKTAIANAKVIYDNTNYSNGDSFKVPHGTTLTLGTNVTATEIEDYKCNLTLSGNTITAMYELVAAIDLGLPSGKLWAPGNIIKDNQDNYSIGEETDFGAYFSWGNIVPHFSANGSTFDDSYDFGTSNSGPYASTPGASVGANIPTNDAQHDAALALLGSPWHLPTKDDFQELYDNTDNEWVADFNGTGVAGRKFMKKTDHSVYVFFPAAGYGYGTSLSNRGSRGNYWSGSWYSADRAYYLYFNSSSVNPQNNSTRYYGLSVRAVQNAPYVNITITLNSTDESSVNNIQVTITDSEGTVHTATTDSNGVVSFNNVTTGLAKVSIQGKGVSPNTIYISTSTKSFILDCMDLEEITGYIINQSNPNAACADMIEMPTVDGVEVAAKDSDDVNSVIHRIWSNTKLYAAATSLSGGKLQIKEVSRTDKTKWADGTTISGTYDYFMKLPEFWWSCSEVSANTDRWNVQFSMEEQTGWNHWEGNTFIGIYKGYIDGSSLYSRRSVTPTVNQSWTTFTTDARNRGTGYSLITYEAHTIMALLGWGWLGTTDDLSIVGRGSTKYPKTTGLCDAKGIVDTVAGVDGGAADGSTSGDVSINFWGLENFWGDIYEWVDNLKIANSSYLVNVLDTNLSTVKRTVQSGATSSSYYGCIGKMVLGSNGEMIPKSFYSNNNYDTGYAAGGSVKSSAGYVACRSSGAASLDGGLGYLYLAYSASNTHSIIGSRLQYKGDFIETNLS